MISLRVIDREEELPALYPAFESWWRGHGWDPVPMAILPRLGVLAEFDHAGTREPIAVAWLYMDNSVGVSMLEWVVSNPTANPRHVLSALTNLITFLKGEAKRLGYGVMLTATRVESLLRLYQKHGFTKTDEGVTHLIAIL